MKRFLFMLFCLPSLLIAQVAGDTKVQEARERAIQFGLDSAVTALVWQLEQEGERRYDTLLLERLESTQDKDLMIAIFKLFTETKNSSARPVAIRFVRDEATSTRLSVMTDALSYLTTVAPQDAEVKDLLWDIIANSAQPERSRFVIIALQFWLKTGDRARGSDLMDLYESDDYPNEPKNTILWLLGEMKEMQALDLMREIASNDAQDPFRRSVAIRAQANIQGESALSEIMPYLSESNNIIRLAVIESAAGFSSREALNIVQGALRDNDINVRTKAINALGARKNTQAIEALSYRALNEEVESVQRAALLALIEINTPEAYKTVEEIFVGSRYPEALRLSALNALLKNHSAGLAPLLLKATGRENLNFPSSFLVSLAGRMSAQKGPYGEFYKYLMASSSVTLKQLAQRGAKLNGINL